MNPLDIPGTDFYFLIPFSFVICLAFSPQIISYQTGGFGLKCFYAVVLVRYLLIPYVNCSNTQYGPIKNCSSSALFYAIMATCLELIVATVTINKYYQKTLTNKSRSMKFGNVQYYNDLGYGGMIIIIFIFAVVFFRGHLDAIINNTRIFIVTESYDWDQVWSYEIWAIQTFFVFFTVTVSSYFQKLNHQHRHWYYIIIPLIVSLIPAMAVLTNNRMTMIYFALSGLMVLQSTFPNYKKFLNVTMVTVMLVVIVSFTLLKNWGIDVTADSGESISHSDLPSTLDGYVCGIFNIAKYWDVYHAKGELFSFITIISDFFNYTQIFLLPGLKPEIFAHIPTTIDIATNGSEMLSLAGQALFWGGDIFGLAFDALFIFISIRMLILFEVHTKIEKDLGKKYVYNWLSLLFGMCMCYCLITLWNNSTYIPFFTSICFWINRKFRNSKTPIKK